MPLSTVTSEDGPWEDAPDEGVLLVEVHAPGRPTRFLFKHDYYIMRDGTLFDVDLAGLHQQIKIGLPMGVVKFGRWASDEAFRAAFRAATGREYQG